MFPNCENSDFVLFQEFFSHDLYRVGSCWKVWISLWIFFLFNLVIWGSSGRKSWVSNSFGIELLNWFNHCGYTNLKHIHTKLSCPSLFFIYRTEAAYNSLQSTRTSNSNYCFRFPVVKNTWPFLLPLKPTQLSNSDCCDQLFRYLGAFTVCYQHVISRQGCDKK